MQGLAVESEVDRRFACLILYCIPQKVATCQQDFIFDVKNERLSFLSYHWLERRVGTKQKPKESIWVSPARKKERVNKDATSVASKMCFFQWKSVDKLAMVIHHFDHCLRDIPKRMVWSVVGTFASPRWIWIESCSWLIVEDQRGFYILGIIRIHSWNPSVFNTFLPWSGIRTSFIFFVWAAQTPTKASVNRWGRSQNQYKGFSNFGFK